MSVEASTHKGGSTGTLSALQIAKNEFRCWARCRHLPQVVVGFCRSFEPAATRGAGTAAFGLWEVTGMGLHRSKQAGVRFPVLGKQNVAIHGLDETTQYRPVCLSLPSTGVRLSSHISGNLYLCWRGTSSFDSLANQERTGILKHAAFPLQGAGRNTQS